MTSIPDVDDVLRRTGAEVAAAGAIAEPPPPPVQEQMPPPPPPPARRRGRGAAGGVVAIALVVGAGGYGIGRATTHSTDAPPVVAAAGPVAATAEPIADVAAAVSPSVVQIETGQGLGSGVLYDAKGHILTAAHVVAGAGKAVTVRLSDGSTHPGTVVGADAAADTAVVSIDPKGLELTPATLATGVSIRVGQTAIAVGSPFGLDQTVTAGIVSAVNRPFSTSTAAIDVLQTDAPINPGNSGGALADREGRIIGINDAIASTSGVNAGIGFAIPIDTAKAVADDIVAGRPVTLAFLGISTQATGRGVVGNGAVIAEVRPGTPAAASGLEVGDVVTALDGATISGPVDLGAAIRAHQPGDEVALTLTRGGSSLTTSVTLGSTHD